MSVLPLSGSASPNLIQDVAYRNSGLTGRLESIVLGAEQIRSAKRFGSAFDASQRTLAAPFFTEVGPVVELLSDDDTPGYGRSKMWRPHVADHHDHDTWASDGARYRTTLARTFARNLIASP